MTFISKDVTLVKFISINVTTVNVIFKRKYLGNTDVVTVVFVADLKSVIALS